MLDLVAHNGILKELILNKLDEYDLSLVSIMEKHGIDKRVQMGIPIWLNTTKPRADRVGHEYIVAICKELGLNVRVQVVISEDFTPDEALKKTNREFKRFAGQRRKSRYERGREKHSDED